MSNKWCDRRLRLSQLTVLGVAFLASAEMALCSVDQQIRTMSPQDGAHTGPDPLTTPLGSLWKLYVFAYQVEQDLPESKYLCRGKDPEEIFCCQPGEAIGRNLALAHSCSPYFTQARARVSKNDWKLFWKKHVENAPTWLLELDRLQPEARVSVDQLLHSLLQMKKNLRHQSEIEAAAVGTVLDGTARGAVNTWGSLLRVKTFTWRDEQPLIRKSQVQAQPQSSLQDSLPVDHLGFTGGFAGWLADGDAIWVSAAGHGSQNLQTDFQTELKDVVERHTQTTDGGCVDVKYFERYPIASISPLSERLVGPVQIKFRNGNTLHFNGDGSLLSQKTKQGFSVTARLSTNEYVARVLDREVQTAPLNAARAFAVAIRTFLKQNSTQVQDCRVALDSSHFQRVSPQSATPGALNIARWSEGLTLDHVPRLRYHSKQNSPNVMSWPQATHLALAGYTMTEILKIAYPGGDLVFGDTGLQPPCVEQPLLQKWVKEQSKLWRKHLQQEPGFEEPEHLKICQMQAQSTSSGRRVFARFNEEEIYVPHLKSREDEISILHEYLHIGFRNHPRARDEAFVESLAQTLVEEK